MNIAIVDDMSEDQVYLEQLLREYAAANQLTMQIDRFTNGEDLLKIYQPYRYTILFLDIFMDGMSGIETAQKIRSMDEDAILIFLTTSESHRPEAFSVFASSYIHKPADAAQLFHILDHILRIRTEMDKRFSFSFDRQEYRLLLADIVSIETDGNYLRITDQEGKVYRTRMTFTHAQTQLDQRFLSLMKGITVNMDYIVQIKDTVCYMQGGASFPMRVKNAKELKQNWLNYKFTAIREATDIAGGPAQ